MHILGNNTPVLMDMVSGGLKKKLISIATVVRYSNKQIIHSRGEVKRGVSIVKSGQVITGTYGINGEFTPAIIFGVGASFGEHTVITGLPRLLDCFADGAAEIYQIPGKKFDVLFDSEPELPRVILAIALIRSHGLLEFVDDLRRLPLPVRTGKILLSFFNANQQSTVINCTQSELASTLGVSRVTLGKTLAQLSKSGLIDLGYRQITLCDPIELSKWVEKQSEVAPLTVPI